MSAEILAMVISATGVVVTLGASMFAGFAWIVRRIDGRVDGLDAKLTTRIDAVEEKLSARIDAVEEKLVRRIDDRVDGLDAKLSARIDAVEEKLSARIDALEERLGRRIDALTVEVIEVKIAVARLEGPPRHLVTAIR